MTKPSYALSSYPLATPFAIDTFTTDPLTTEPLQQISGQIVDVLQDGSFKADFMANSHANREWHCRRAVSCLLTPCIGDTVLITQINNQRWILAILERAEQQSIAEISVPGDLAITAQGNLSMNSNDLTITANNGNCHISEMQYSGKSLSAWISITRLVGNQFESLWKTVTQLSHRLFRHTTQTEQVRAGQLDMRAENYARLHAQQTMVTAKAMTKIDAEQIHIG
ncbi:DUF3540 domain-containing protein [Xenorhabdus sp. DI]|uniref:DUF3540 domain-containing protein n=1 Tax=Xenorhabdus doucetiae TaxID=351671 RepID=UPI0019ADF810|nr:MULTISPECIES: DUF3540 domain-containing protein [unclassified Xenorhabdus]MBD2785621.1 DUF3540 domain-containing protein [Xenorhabdus sp. 3]MBD2787006.1 DUF3540 domain-containing protein [Xenorhabdus sp. DI]